MNYLELADKLIVAKQALTLALVDLAVSWILSQGRGAIPMQDFATPKETVRVKASTTGTGIALRNMWNCFEEEEQEEQEETGHGEPQSYNNDFPPLPPAAAYINNPSRVTCWQQ